MDEENIEVVSSEDGGNGLPPETPSTQAPEQESVKDVVVPQETTPEEPAKTPEVELFDLPDGRKVDAQTLSREFKENFLPEFTRKSQALAELEKAKQTKTTDVKPYQDPEWQPQTYAELIELAKQEVKSDLQREQMEALQQRQAIEDSISQQLGEIKQIEPSFNENALFVHATKYGFKDLKLAHQNMKDMSEMAKKVQETTAKNIAKRNDPVSMTPGATGAKPNPSQFGTAVEYLRSLGK